MPFHRSLMLCDRLPLLFIWLQLAVVGYLLHVADRLVVAFSTLLIRKDGYLQGMDSLVNDTPTASLRYMLLSPRPHFLGRRLPK